jgi:hypothetical protein
VKGRKVMTGTNTTVARRAARAHGQPPGQGWPLSCGLGPLGALPSVPRLARAFTVVALGGWGLSPLIEDAELVVGELTGNVVRAATGPDGKPRYDQAGRLPVLWLRLLSDRERAYLEVWDTIPADLGAPAVRHAGPDDESGRGLEIVAALSLDWGWEHAGGRAAKSLLVKQLAGRGGVARLPSGAAGAALFRTGRGVWS